MANQSLLCLLRPSLWASGIELFPVCRIFIFGCKFVFNPSNFCLYWTHCDALQNNCVYACSWSFGVLMSRWLRNSSCFYRGRGFESGDPQRISVEQAIGRLDRFCWCYYF
jgi:hypothetical protein